MNNTVIDKRTKGEWKVYPKMLTFEDNAIGIAGDVMVKISSYEDKKVIAHCNGIIGDKSEAEANAAFIVTACNAYDTLIENNRLLLEVLKDISYEYEMRMRQSAVLGNWQYKEDSTSIKAKEAINKCNPLT